LKGKSIAVGPAGGGTLPILEAVLEAYGLSIDDITPSYLSYADGFSQLSDDNVDVALALSGYPASSVMEVSATKKIKFINIDKDKMAKMIEKYPYYSEITVPKDVYKLDNDATAVGVLNTLIVSNKLDEATVYSMTKAIFDNLDEFKEANATAKQIDLETASQAAIPLHPGAKKYFDEKK
jgi:TRAP transporter TAXI family solute receptor